MEPPSQALSSQARALLGRAVQRRIQHEIDEIRSLAATSGGRLELAAVQQSAGVVFGVALVYRMRTSVSPAPGQPPEDHTVPVPARVEARLAIEHYPHGPLSAGLLSDLPLFLPAVLNLPALVEGRFAALACLHRRFDQRLHTLPFYAEQIFRCLSCAPEVINSVTDAPNPRAARYFIDRRARLDLPFEPELRAPDRSRSPPQTAGVPRFRITRVGP